MQCWLVGTGYEEARGRAELDPKSLGVILPGSLTCKMQARSFICPDGGRTQGSFSVPGASWELLALLVTRRQELPSLGPGRPLTRLVHPYIF